MNPGELRHRITLQSMTTVPDAEGIAVRTWTTFATVWGRYKDLSGRELLAAQSIAAEVNGHIDMRYRAGITPKMRALWNGRTFDILAAPDKEGLRRYLELYTREVIAGA